MTEDVKVVFMPSGRRGIFPKGTALLSAARSLGVDIDSVCGGRGLCGRCQISCMSGSFPKHEITSSPDHLSALSETEKKYSTRKSPLASDRRLSCHTQLLGDVVIDVPPESQMHRQIIRKEAEHRDIHLNTTTRLYYVPVEETTLENPLSERHLLFKALADEWQLYDLSLNPALLPTLQRALIEGKRGVTVALHNQQTIIGIWPGLYDQPRGIAVDVGSTTVAAHLCDLNTGAVLATAGIMNPQIRFGEDLMSRVSYVMMHPEGAGQMRDAIRDALNQLFLELSEKAESSVEDILEVSLVANPIMHHLVLGIDPVNLGGAPFALTIRDALDIPARDVGLNIHSEGRLYTLPCIAGHVGADAAGVILAESPYQGDEMSLIVDVGTNAEIVLGNRDRLLVCSSPTGPAFEGAQITCGQRATFGAIERVRIDRDTLEPRFKIIGADAWSDEPEFLYQDRPPVVTGICGSGIIEVVAEMFLAGLISADGVINGSLADRCPRLKQEGRTWSYILHFGPGESDSDIVITQTDIRQIQLAKAALYAGIKLLMDKMGVTHVDRIRLAGAFGSHISVTHAMVLGLIPDCVVDQVSSAGNAAAMGARLALLDRESRGEIEQTVRLAERIETAVEAKFQDYFVEAMAFPNKTDPFPNLFAVVEPPEQKTVDAEESPRRRRRARTA
ncbi:MAG: ASKHA domain-containing protein [Halieaceae bacterium]